VAFVSEPPALAKFSILGVFSVPAIVFLMSGMAISRFDKWRLHVGIVLLSASGSLALVILVFVCVSLSPELKHLFAKPQLSFVPDYISGITTICLVALVGLFLILAHAKVEKST
jgi:hypothetical protein